VKCISIVHVAVANTKERVRETEARQEYRLKVLTPVPSQYREEREKDLVVGIDTARIRKRPRQLDIKIIMVSLTLSSSH
jgi:hypothetical protein